MKSGVHDVVLSVTGLTKSYGDVQAVKNLSFEIKRGEIFGFLGPNGAGKTTTINILCGLLNKDSGNIEVSSELLKFNGRMTTAHKNFKQSLGLCPQDLVIWEELSCLEQLEILGRLYDLNTKEAKRKSLELLEVLGLLEKKDKLAKTLSGGMKRRLNIALALIHDPEILVLDEPQAGLDPQSRLLVREYIRSLVPNITVLLTTHDMNEADLLSDRVAIIDHGELLVIDSPENLKSRMGIGDILEIKFSKSINQGLLGFMRDFPGNVQVQEGNKLQIRGFDNMDRLPSILGGLKKTGMGIEDITIRKKTLEDVFIGLTGRRLRE